MLDLECFSQKPVLPNYCWVLDLEKNYSTQYSRVVPHHSTDCAITSLTSEIRRDPVLSGVYGRSYYDCTKKPENLLSLDLSLFSH